MEHFFVLFTQEHRQEVVDEVCGVLESIWDTHGDGKWKSKLLIRDALVSSALQQVSFAASFRDIVFGLRSCISILQSNDTAFLFGKILRIFSSKKLFNGL